jgi:hypothetical protein
MALEVREALAYLPFVLLPLVLPVGRNQWQAD